MVFKNNKLSFLFILLFSSQYLVGMNHEQQAPATVDWEFWKNMLLTDSSQALVSARNACLEGRWPFTVCQHPFFLLNETNEEDSLYARSCGKRDMFEEAIGDWLVDLIDSNPDSMIHYVDFASGQLFSVFLTLVKTFQQRPNAKIRCSAIDCDYGLSSARQEYVWIKEQIETSIRAMFPGATLELVLIDNSKQNSEQTADLLTIRPDIITSCAIPSPEFYQEFLVYVFSKHQNVPNFFLSCGEQTSDIAESVSYVFSEGLNEHRVSLAKWSAS